MRFLLTTKLEIIADNLDDAFIKLSHYFKSKADGDVEDGLDTFGEVHLHEIKSTEEKHKHKQ